MFSETASRRQQSYARTRRIVRMDTVRSLTGLSRSTIYRKIREGTFPAQLKITIAGAGWHASEIARWVANPAAWRPSNDNDDPGRKARIRDAG
ncbi:MAG: AlpA family phage regulatory protein [Methylorubrum populi]